MMRSRLQRALVLGTLSAAISGTRPAGQTEAPDGSVLFKTRCISCHSGEPSARAPSAGALGSRSPQAVIESLVNGVMRVQGSRMSGPERRAVAEFLTGRTIDEDVAGAAIGRCSVPSTAEVSMPAWRGWSPSVTNTRFQPAVEARLAAGDLSRLTLKWAFGFPDAASAWSQPTVAGGRVFVGSQNGTVYALDSRSGCVRWTFGATGGVRTAVTAGLIGGRDAVFFADTAANAYALDAGSGERLWVRKVEDHLLARVTGSPTLFEGRLYVPVSSYEESQGADPQYGCCTFRGSLVALDAATGSIVWKTYMVDTSPSPRGMSSAGIQLWGPSGSAVWSAPTVDFSSRKI